LFGPVQKEGRHVGEDVAAAVGGQLRQHVGTRTARPTANFQDAQRPFLRQIGQRCGHHLAHQPAVRFGKGRFLVQLHRAAQIAAGEEQLEWIGLAAQGGTERLPAAVGNINFGVELGELLANGLPAIF
jgi:hypothetical protein